jgi:hypothetical protein
LLSTLRDCKGTRIVGYVNTIDRPVRAMFGRQ